MLALKKQADIKQLCTKEWIVLKNNVVENNYMSLEDDAGPHMKLQPQPESGLLPCDT